LTHLHKTQKHSITTTHSLPRTSRATVFQNLLNRYAGGEIHLLRGCSRTECKITPSLPPGNS